MRKTDNELPRKWFAEGKVQSTVEILRRKKLIFWEICFPSEPGEVREDIIGRGTEAQMYGIFVL